MCRGTTNGEDVYVIPFDSIPDRNKEVFKALIPNIIEKHHGIPVDKCIGREIEGLVKSGVITYGCCCGHGKYEPTCIIDESSLDLVKRLGYDVKFEIRLKGGR